MKTVKSYIWMAAATMLVATLGACSNDDLTAIETPIQKGKVVTLTATLSPKDGGSTTRALSDNGTSIGSTWVVNEKVLVKYLSGAYSSPAEAEGTVTSVDGNGKATITVTLDDPTDGDTPISFYYPYVSYTGEKLIGMEQTGTLADISANYDRVSGSGTLHVSGGIPTLPNDVGMTREVCIWKLAFTDGSSDITGDITNLTISDGNGNDYIVSPPAGAKSAIWVAMAGITSKTVTITATTGSGLYTAEKSITLANGKFYRSTVPLTATTTANKYVVYTSGTDHYDAVIPSVASAVTSSATGVTWEAGTYLVSADATIEGNVTLAGNVNLILCDGATLTITGIIENPQDAEYNYTHSMNIYGQSGSTGGLNVVASDINVQIHNLNFHGGVITVTDGGVMQGIETTGRFNIYHGTINAAGGAGGVISLGNMFVYGGSVTATSTNSDGIYANNNVTISGGTVTATSTDAQNGMNILGDLNVTGGITTATGANGFVGIVSGSLTLGTGIKLYEGDSPNPSTPAADQSVCSKRYVKIQ